jgi:N-hydroxyarylamine O-acetyltransferase
MARIGVRSSMDRAARALTSFLAARSRADPTLRKVLEMNDALDLDAYFARIAYRGSRAPTLDTLHAITAAHVQSIPFENLDVLLGRPIGVDGESVFRKLVTERRGGYCFEQNGLLLQVLGALGFDVKPLSARVRLQRPRDFIPPRTHMFLRVEIDGVSWLTDVGFGGASLTSAIRLEADVAQTTPHDARRLVREGALWFHQVRYGDEWQDVYDFTTEEMPLIDRTVANWYTSAHPESHFRHRLIVARALPEGRRIALLNGDLTLRGSDGRGDTRAIATADELLAVLTESFGLHFAPGTRFGAPGAAGLPWPT